MSLRAFGWEVGGSRRHVRVDHGQLIEHEAHVRVLDRWIHTRVLRLDSLEAAALVGELMSRPLGEQMRIGLGQEPRFQQSLGLARQHQTLAPKVQSAFGHATR